MFAASRRLSSRPFSRLTTHSSVAQTPVAAIRAAATAPSFTPQRISEAFAAADRRKFFSTTTTAEAAQQHQEEHSRTSRAPLYGAAAVTAVCASLVAATDVYALEEADENKTPAFDPAKTRYDPKTYWGRVKLMRDMTDPSTLLCSEQDLADCQALLKSWKKGKKYTDEEHEKFWWAKKVVDSTIHPVTGEVMFLPGRMSAYVPANVPITSGMIIFGPRSIGSTMFWQWMNQSVNVGCNYANRSGSAIDNNKLFGSYMLACSSACFVAVGLSLLTKRVVALQRLGLVIPYFAVCTANAANMFSTRMEEWQTGVPVFDKNGKQLGLSAKAGFEGVWQTLVNRGWITPIPFLIAPPVIMAGLKPFIPGGAVATLVEVGVITAAMYYSIPYTLALSAQTLELSPATLEEQFQGLKYKDGSAVDVIYVNKGL
mmetsp:Transcript_27145/g.68461  ORF Transcript_27145/g.68461 Transcript_27145/m.68461 type:complete len:428 (+) Transcript_27145:311-1594(+)|eukprot:CAMPEP_0178991106 /NCGR_PEP_ID=MMETSP0795-20121207/5335_1 /TAXON_ID=88552 /ORGANISM="Amoebophrya sp., Strain Ameob2" /LENGTH=427 /DNA_ID=CAMNT_0020682761 /DNA_START=294 /DNA_END=1577 /DNA_ORIENTATION=-